MKIRKIIPVILVLIFSLLMMTACSGNDIVEEEIAEYTDDVLGVIYSIYKVTDGDAESFYAKVATVDMSTSAYLATSITIPSIITYNNTDYNVTKIGSLAFYKSNYSIIRISEGITTIEKFAFDRAQSTSVDLPTSITSIEEYAFLDCLSLQEINLYAVTPPTLGDYAFMVCNSDGEYINSEILRINVPYNSKALYIDVNTYPQWQSYVGNVR